MYTSIELLPGVDTTEFLISCQEDNSIIIAYGCYYLLVYLEYISLIIVIHLIIFTIIVIHALDNSINYYVNFILYLLCDVLSQIHCIIINTMRNEIMSVVYDRDRVI